MCERERERDRQRKRKRERGYNVTAVFTGHFIPQNGESDEMLGKHPLSGLDGAGTMLSLLRKQFHSLLQTTADIMPKVSLLGQGGTNCVHIKIPISPRVSG